MLPFKASSYSNFRRFSLWVYPFVTDSSLRALVTTLKSLGDLEKDGCTVALPESRAFSERVEAGGGPKVSLSSSSRDDD